MPLPRIGDRKPSIQEEIMKKNIFVKSIDVGMISFQQLQYLLLIAYGDDDPLNANVRNEIIEKLEELEKEWLDVKD